jgi:hypothetical protein
VNALFSSPGLLVILLAANLPILLLLLRFAFDSWEEVGEAIFFWLGPIWLQIADVLRGGDWGEHQWDSLKVVVVLLVFGGMVLSEYAFISARFRGAVEWANRVVPLGVDTAQGGSDSAR